MREKRRRAILIGLMLAATTALLSAQSNERIDELLAQEPAQIGHTAYLVLTAAGAIDESATPAQAIAAAQEAGWLPAGVTVDDPTRFGDFSYLLTGSFGVAGGVMYRLVPGPRYAAREVVYRGWSRSQRSPAEIVSGDVVTRVLSVYVNSQGGAR
jgi:hypothetical protein